MVFFDYNSGYCKSVFPALQALLTRDQTIKIVYKEFPILGPESQMSAQAALAANRQGKYAAFHQALLDSKQADNDTIKRVSLRLGLNYAITNRYSSDE